MKRLLPVAALTLVVGAMLVGVRSARPERAAAAGAQSPLATGGAGFDFEALTQRVHFAFYAEGTSLVGGDATYHVERTATGQVRLTARDVGPAARVAAPWTWQSFSAAREGWEQRVDLSTARVDPQSGALEAKAGLLTHRLANEQGGVEQSLDVAAAPPGTGALRFQFSVAGLEYRGATAEGLEFADRASRLGFRYGRGTWVGADGRRVDIAPEYEDGTIRLVIDEHTLEHTQFPATLDPFILPVAVDLDSPLPMSLVVVAGAPSTACTTGNVCLIVWGDSRDNNLGRNQVFGAVFDTATGTVTTPTGFQVSNGGGSDTKEPVIAYLGAEFLVVWSQTVSGGTDLFYRSVSSAGSLGVLNSLPLPGNQDHPALAGGPAPLVLWADNRGMSSGTGYDIWGARVTLGSTLQAPFHITSALGDETDPRAAPAPGNQYFVVWQSSTGMPAVMSAHIDSSNNVLEPNGVPLSPSVNAQRAPDVTGTGSGVLAAWEEDMVPAGGPTVVVCLLDAGAAFTPSPGVGQRAPRLACGKQACVVVWQADLDGGFDAVSSTINGAFSMGSAAVTLAAAGNRHLAPSIAANDGGFLATWLDHRVLGDIRGTQLTPSGVTSGSTDTALSLAVNAQRAPVVAYNGSEFMAAWEDNRDPGDRAIVAARFDDFGNSLDPTGIVMRSGGGQPARSSRPAIAASSGSFFVAWQEEQGSGSKLFCARTSPDGTTVVPDAGLASLSGSAEEPALAATDDSLFVAWRDGVNPGGGIYGAVYAIATFPQVISPPFAIATGAGTKRDPAVAWGGASEFAVAWSDLDAGAIFATISTASGTVTPRVQLTSPGVISARNPVIDFDGRRYFVAWEQLQGSAFSITGAFLEQDGGLGVSGIVVSRGSSGPVRRPAVVFDGIDHNVVWESSGSQGGDLSTNSVRASTMDSGSTFQLRRNPEFEVEPALAFSAPGAVLVFADYDTNDAGHAFRVRRNWVDFRPLALSVDLAPDASVPTNLTLNFAGPPLGSIAVFIDNIDMGSQPLALDGGAQLGFVLLPGSHTLRALTTDRAGQVSPTVVVPFTVFTVDAGVADAGTVDAGVADGGARDAGSADAGPLDAGPKRDGGATDAGRDGSVESDGGAQPDGGGDGGLAFRITSELPASPACDSVVTYEATATQPATWSIFVGQGNAAVDATTGVLTINVAAPGRVRLVLRALSADGVLAEQELSYDAPCTDHLTACGCSSSGSEWVLALWAVLPLARRRLRRGRSPHPLE